MKNKNENNEENKQESQKTSLKAVKKKFRSCNKNKYMLRYIYNQI